MSWKIFTTAILSAGIISFPQNIIGCGPGIDPYDYYTSFFDPSLSENESLRPFYYTGYSYLYSETEAIEPIDLLAAEWGAYAGVTPKAAKSFLTNFTLKELTALYTHSEKKLPLKGSAALKSNALSEYFIRTKDSEALGYLLYAKKVEPHVGGNSDAWEPLQRDSTVMARLMKNGTQLYAAAKKDFIKLRYGYQVVRLAHYSGNYSGALNNYETLVQPVAGESIVRDLATGIKAGALWRSGRDGESVYLFSKLFGSSPVKKLANYQSFNWAVNSSSGRDAYLALCKTPEERADMLALFAAGSTADELPAIKMIFAADPENKHLPLLITREINKIEEFYLTPVLNAEPGGRAFYGYWNNTEDQKVKARAESFTLALEKFATLRPADAGLYQTAAAYSRWMLRDNNAARKLLKAATEHKLNKKTDDQWQLVNLLVNINAADRISKETENTILPSLDWLRKKALKDTVPAAASGGTSTWKLFYRNTLAEILAKKYHSQGDVYKETLVIGAAENLTGGEYQTLDFLRTKTDIRDVEKLHAFFTAKSSSGFDEFLLKHNALNAAHVADFAGTAYLRDYDYPNAIKWLEKIPTSAMPEIIKDPFIELLYDREEAFAFEKKVWTRLSFAKEMQRLEKLAESDRASAAKHYYKMALGLYNITYYGHAWELVQYSRSGSDGYYIPKNATKFQREYYGAFAAHDMFKKAMAAAGDKNFRGKCLFMMAKCSQKALPRPQWADFPESYEAMSAAEKTYYVTFRNNRYFPEFVNDYKGTPFYQEALNSCSYLRDFVRR